MRTIIKAKKGILALLFVYALMGFSAAPCQNTISAWLPYWDIKNSIGIFEDCFFDTINTVNAFAYAFDENDHIINISKDKTLYEEMLTRLKQHNVKLILTITNDTHYKDNSSRLKDPDLTHRILADTALRQRHIQEIISLVNKYDTDGIDIDYESMYYSDKEHFTLFIKELARKLHAQDKILHVTVEQKTEDHTRSGPGAIDWKEISRYADQIIIMCYNYSSRLSKPGPICPPFWLKKILRFAREQIPDSKICIALPLHGFDWNIQQTRSVHLKKVNELITKHNPRIIWDKHNASPHFSYSENGITHNVWFEDKYSINEKIKLIKQSRIQHISLWHLGILDTSFKEALQDFSS